MSTIPGSITRMLMQDSESSTAIQTVYLASAAADGRILFWDYSFLLTYDRCCLCNVNLDRTPKCNSLPLHVYLKSFCRISACCMTMQTELY